MSNVQEAGPTLRQEPEWLTPAELETWLAFGAASGLLMAALDKQLLRDAGIPHTWYGLLAILSEQPAGTARQSDLGTFASFSLSRLSHAVNRLEERGWLARRADPDDGRATLVTLTAAGRAALVQAAPGHAAEVRRLFLSRLTPDQARVLTEACTAVLAGLSPFPPRLRRPQSGPVEHGT